MKVVFIDAENEHERWEATTQSFGPQTVPTEAVGLITAASPTAAALRLPPWAAGHGELSANLPRALSARAFGPAWTVAVGAHIFLAALAILAPGHLPTPEPPPVRMVFLEPPPPPPAALGVPNAAGETASLPSLEQAELTPPQQVEPPIEKPRLRHPAVTAKAPRRLRPVVRPPADDPPPSAPRAGSHAGVVQGEPGGVVGGVAGGLEGGIVGGHGSAPIPADQLTHRPKLLHRVAPVYSAEARRLDRKGLVILEVILDHEGRVEPAVKVLQSIPLLDEEAVRAVRQWRFEPARDTTGRPVRVILEVPLRFVLR